MRAKCICLFSENFETTMQVIFENNMFHLRELNTKMGKWVLNLNASHGFTGREVSMLKEQGFEIGCETRIGLGKTWK
jgi:hypothetical protein